jgi:hypothetical protein
MVALDPSAKPPDCNRSVTEERIQLTYPRITFQKRWFAGVLLGWESPQSASDGDEMSL